MNREHSNRKAVKALVYSMLLMTAGIAILAGAGASSEMAPAAQTVMDKTTISYDGAVMNGYLENGGQWDDTVLFASPTSFGHAAFGRDHILFDIVDGDGSKGSVIRLDLVDTNDVVVRDADGALVAHYLLVIHFGRWLSGCPVAGDDCVEARFVALDEIGAFKTTDRLAYFILKAHACWQAQEG